METQQKWRTGFSGLSKFFKLFDLGTRLNIWQKPNTAQHCENTIPQ